MSALSYNHTMYDPPVRAPISFALQQLAYAHTSYCPRCTLAQRLAVRALLGQDFGAIKEALLKSAKAHSEPKPVLPQLKPVILSHLEDPHQVSGGVS